MKISVPLLLACVVGVIRTSAQVLPNGNVTQQSPTASPNAAHANYGDNVSVDPFTGKLNMTFSLYSFADTKNGLEHGVNLSYDGGGVRVDNIASNVGLGWSLSFGGIITRQIKGFPDELPNGYNRGIRSPISKKDTVNLNKVTEGKIDEEYDEYYYSAGSASGKFIIGRNNKILVIPQSNIKIERTVNNSPLYSQNLDSCRNINFKITLKSGTQYYYSNYDCSCTDSSSEHRRYGSSTWYLSKIVSTFNKDSILFSYAPHIQSYLVGNTFTRYSSRYNSSYNSNPNTSDAYTFQDKIYIRRLEQLLNSISYPDGTTLTINYESFNRYDLQTDFAIRNISISNVFTSRIKGFKFDYSYFTRPGGQKLDYKSYYTKPIKEEDISLRLDGFKMFSGSDTLPGYSFAGQYNGLRSRGSSYGVDQWGFNSSSDSRFPDLVVANYTFPTSNNASPSILNATSGAIDEISTPLGGKMLIDYELNDIQSETNQSANRAIGGLRVKRLVTSDQTNQTNNLTKEYRYVRENSIVSSGVIVNKPIKNFTYSEVYVPDGANPNHPMPNSSDPDIQYSYDLVSNYLHPNTPSLSFNTYMACVSEPLNEMQLMKGNPVGYSRVEEYLGTTTSFKQKTVYTFTTDCNWIPDSLKGEAFPFATRPDLDFSIGLPTSVSQFNSMGLMLSKSEIEYEKYFTLLNQNEFISTKVGISKHSNVTPAYSTCYYYPISGKIFPIRTKASQFYSGNGVVESITQTEFDTARILPRIVYSSDSRGEPVKTHYYYPYDFNISGAIATLNTQNINYSPVRVEVWKGSQGNERIVDASVSSFRLMSDNSVRPDASYHLTTQEPISFATWGAFNNAQLLPNSQHFTATTQVDAYDSYGNATQTTTSGIISSQIWGYKNTKLIAEVTNAKSLDIAYSSFEGDGWGNWETDGSSSIMSSQPAITGTNVCNVSSNGLVKNNLDPSKKYVITFWSPVNGNIPSLRVNGITLANVSASDTHKGWTLYRAEVDQANSIRIAATTNNTIIDELRLYPKGAAMATHTYDPMTGVTSNCDASNHCSYFEYDGFGRLAYMRNIDGQIIKAYSYKVAEPQN